ncbi:MerC domain-containing protein [Sphingomonas nostoxanthinifaciens]|uniref:MerC domain-containing protein n=1 Tax=Sphingomonas nostoxanthinifaciens TaxID=2872652 RepID=UPI001CC1E6B1|nr:MerC domain-containing protein [Sphingomonas nostoxanthinifaciens]UAK24486.1 MerC domain-containing protein [Sphingomonas nostoxanthinifaciens]
MAAMNRKHDMIEALALGATFACLAHCIALPLLLALLPALAAIVPVPTEVHLVALGLAIPATGFALWSGYRHHGGARPLAMGLLGLAMLAIAVWPWGGSVLEAPITICGSIAIGAAHLGNWRLRRQVAHVHAA